VLSRVHCLAIGVRGQAEANEVSPGQSLRADTGEYGSQSPWATRLAIVFFLITYFVVSGGC